MRTPLALIFVLWLGVHYLLAESSCVLKEELPIGTANQGGYLFNYQSRRGNECRMYRLRNMPGKVQTPARWKDSNEVFWDTDLPDCRVGEECGWIETTKISTSEVFKGDSNLSYGVNKDEYSDTPDAFRKRAASKGKLPAFVTELRGVVADQDHKRHRLALRLSSYAYAHGTNAFSLVYKIEITGESEAVGLLSLSGFAKNNESLNLLWESAKSKQFLDYLAKKNFEEVSSKAPSITVEIESSDIELDEWGQVTILKGDRRVASTSAAAYRPKE